jgi:hypothetical protein
MDFMRTPNRGMTGSEEAIGRQTGQDRALEASE